MVYSVDILRYYTFISGHNVVPQKIKSTFIYITKQADLLTDLHLGLSPYSPYALRPFLTFPLCPII